MYCVKLLLSQKRDLAEGLFPTDFLNRLFLRRDVLIDITD